jgi:RNA polymerase Rpb2, domain 6
MDNYDALTLDAFARVPGIRTVISQDGVSLNISRPSLGPEFVNIPILVGSTLWLMARGGERVVTMDKFRNDYWNRDKHIWCPMCFPVEALALPVTSFLNGYKPTYVPHQIPLDSRRPHMGIFKQQHSDYQKHGPQSRRPRGSAPLPKRPKLNKAQAKDLTTVLLYTADGVQHSPNNLDALAILLPHAAALVAMKNDLGNSCLYGASHMLWGPMTTPKTGLIDDPTIPATASENKSKLKQIGINVSDLGDLSHISKTTRFLSTPVGDQDCATAGNQDHWTPKHLVKKVSKTLQQQRNGFVARLGRGRVFDKNTTPQSMMAATLDTGKLISVHAKHTPKDFQLLKPSQFGFLCCIQSPDTSKAGMMTSLVPGVHVVSQFEILGMDKLREVVATTLKSSAKTQTRNSDNDDWNGMTILLQTKDSFTRLDTGSNTITKAQFTLFLELLCCFAFVEPNEFSLPPSPMYALDVLVYGGNVCIIASLDKLLLHGQWHVTPNTLMTLNAWGIINSSHCTAVFGVTLGTSYCPTRNSCTKAAVGSKSVAQSIIGMPTATGTGVCLSGLFDNFPAETATQIACNHPQFALLYPQHSLIAEAPCEVGQIFSVLFMPYMSNNVEDAMILKRDAVERGLGMTQESVIYKINVEMDAIIGVCLVVPGLEKALRFKYCDNGNHQFERILRRPIQIRKSMGRTLLFTLYGATKVGCHTMHKITVASTSYAQTHNVFWEDMYHYAGDSHQINGVSLVGIAAVARTDKSAVITLNFDLVRQMLPGDKFNNSPGQKGVVSQFVPEPNMPFIHGGPMSGSTPDLIINIASCKRQTPGWFIGMNLQTSKIGSNSQTPGINPQQVVGQQDFEFDINALAQALNLREDPASRVRNVALCDGITGELLTMDDGKTLARGDMCYMSMCKMHQEAGNSFHEMSVNRYRENTGQHFIPHGRASVGGGRQAHMENVVLSTNGDSPAYAQFLRAASNDGAATIVREKGFPAQTRQWFSQIEMLDYSVTTH